MHSRPSATASPISTSTLSIDRFGALASGLCAVHCALSAFLPSLLAAAGLGALLGHEAEWTFTLIAVGFAGIALFLAMRTHRTTWVAAAFSTGMSGLLLSRFAEEAGAHGFGTVLGVLSGLFLVVAHLANIRVSRRLKKS